MKKNGFISMTTILTLIVVIGALLILNIDTKMKENDLLNKTKSDSRKIIENSDYPHCFWSPNTSIKTNNETNIYVTCINIDGINLMDNNVNNLIENNTSLTINSINIYEINSGYKIILNVKSNSIGTYNISLLKNKFCTNSNKCNNKLISNNITVES